MPAADPSGGQIEQGRRPSHRRRSPALRLSQFPLTVKPDLGKDQMPGVAYCFDAERARCVWGPMGEGLTHPEIALYGAVSAPASRKQIQPDPTRPSRLAHAARRKTTAMESAPPPVPPALVPA